MITEGMELTRGTKKIIQEAIDTVDDQYRNDRIRLCEEFCRIVENRYTGGAMSYQLKRMGNTYPLDLLSKNGWSIQDALDNGLVVYLSSDWFMDDRVIEHEGHFYKEKKVIINTQLDSQVTEQLHRLPILTVQHLIDLDIEIITDLSKADILNTQEISTWERVSEDEEFHLNEKIYWLSDLVMSEDANGDKLTMSSDEILNFNEVQAKSKGMLTGRTNSVKIPLETTGPILEAIDKYLYDKTGQYIV